MKTTLRKTILAICIGLVFVCMAAFSGVMLFSNNKAQTPTSSSLASASGSGVSSAVVTAEHDSVVSGSIVEITVTFKARQDENGRYWFAINSWLVPLTEDGTKVDSSLFQYLRLPTQAEATAAGKSYTYTRGNFVYSAPAEVASLFSSYGVNFVDLLNPATGTSSGIFLAFDWGGASGDLSNFTSSSEAYQFVFPLVVDSSIDGTGIETIRLGFAPVGDNRVSTIDSRGAAYSEADTAETGALAVTDVVLNIRKPNEDADIDKIEIGVVDPDDPDPDPDPEPKIDVTFEEEDDPDDDGNVVNYAYVILPNTPGKTLFLNTSFTKESEGATIKYLMTDEIDNKPISPVMNTLPEKGAKVNITEDQHVIYMEVTSEDTSTTEIYYLSCYFSYVRLDELTFVTDSPAFIADPETPEDLLEDLFDTDTLTYESIVYPNDGNAAKLSATILEGYGATKVDNPVINVTASNCMATGKTIPNGNSISVTSVNDYTEITLRIYSMAHQLTSILPSSHSLYQTANNAYTEYTLSFDVCSVYVKIELTVGDPDSPIANDTDTADQEGVDGYYHIMDDEVPVSVIATQMPSADEDAEPGDPAKYVIVQLVPKTDDSGNPVIGEDGEQEIEEKIVFDSEADDADPDSIKLGEGEYLIKAEAEAGNHVRYSFVLAKLSVIKIVEGSDYQFLAVEKDESGKYYRRAYAELTTADGELGWVHGVDDKSFDRFELLGFGEDDWGDDSWTNEEWMSNLNDNNFYKQSKTLLDHIVIGQILPKTEVTTFLEEIEKSQWALLRFYNIDGDLVFENGDYTDAVVYDSDKFVATGWRVELGSAENPSDTVYLSVLGDIYRDGYITTDDSSRVNAYLVKTADEVANFRYAEVWLAALICNDGYVTTDDSSAINSMTVNAVTPDYYFYHESSTED